ncbi:PBP1A family penicillin-binding protein [bacterium]|nr:PBP1A family penicillin-binding protein [bacterium]
MTIKSLFRRVKQFSPKSFILFLSAIGLVSLLVFGLTYSFIKQGIDERFEQLFSAKSSQFLAPIPPIKIGQKFTQKQLQTLLEYSGFQEKKTEEDLQLNEFRWSLPNNEKKLELIRAESVYPGNSLARSQLTIKFKTEESTLIIDGLSLDENQESIDSFELPPKRISSFYAGRLRTQTPVPLSEIPVDVRHAVMAIEDVNFLEHGGISLKSTLRALYKDLIAGKFVEGGSTITQQLMKNLFFSREKSVSRKAKEAIYAFITESTHSKESILEAYLNEVYLGQWSTHEIHGVSEAARFYFNRSIFDLSLSQSATLAAIIQAPNSHDPRRNPANALKRRNLVLKKMSDANFILPGEYQMAINEPLGVTPGEKNLQDTGYFMDLVLSQLPEDLKLRLNSDALTVYTTLNPYLQLQASQTLKDHLALMKKSYESITKKAEKGIQLQSAFISLDVLTGRVLALQGGSSYQKTQFNRILQGKRQPGSLFKPFVFLAAFDKADFSPPFTAITELDGSPFEWMYEGNQSWKPKNYDKDSPEKVTAKEALVNSINIPTARLAQAVGLDPIVDLIKRSGVKSEIIKIPSICLGSTEVTPFELAESYATLANNGKGHPLSSIEKVIDQSGQTIFEPNFPEEERLPAASSYLTVQLLKDVLSQGTGKAAAMSGLNVSNMAGKTGTTNDYKDAWFVGFTPKLLTLIWVGYDEEEKVGLTGSAAALPMWIDFMKTATPFYDEQDFKIPDGILEFRVNPK